MRRVNYYVHRIGVKVEAKAAKSAKRRTLLWGNTSEKTRLHIAPANCYLREPSFMVHGPGTLNQDLCGFMTLPSMFCHNRWRTRMVVPKDEKATLRISSLSS